MVVIGFLVWLAAYWVFVCLHAPFVILYAVWWQRERVFAAVLALSAAIAGLPSFPLAFVLSSQRVVGKEGGSEVVGEAVFASFAEALLYSWCGAFVVSALLLSLLFSFWRALSR